VAALGRDDASVLVLARTSAEGLDQVLILANLDLEKPQACPLRDEDWAILGETPVDLLGQPLPASRRPSSGGWELTLGPGACHCLSAQASVRGLAGEAYRNARAQAAWALQALAAVHPAEALGPAPWRDLARRVAPDPAGFLAALPHLDGELLRRDLLAALDGAMALPAFPQVTAWRLEDARRVSLVPPCHWLLLQDFGPFQATLRMRDQPDLHLRGVPMATGFVAAVPPMTGRAGAGTLLLRRHVAGAAPIEAALSFLPEAPELPRPGRQGLALLTNGRGGMARLAGDLGAIASKYDCLLGANLHPSAPSDRHVLAKRLRAWVNADGFITALDGRNRVRFELGATARWTFRASAGDGRWVELGLEADMPGSQKPGRRRAARGACSPGRGRCPFGFRWLILLARRLPAPVLGLAQV